jgi:hypothetical protein
MSERTDDLTREIEDDGVEVGDIGVDDQFEDTVDDTATDFSDFGTEQTGDTEQAASTAATGVGGRVKGRVEDAFSLPSFALNAVAALAATFVIGGALPLGPLSGIVGVFVSLFVLGVVSIESRYVEAGLAGALSGVLTTVFTTITLSVVSGGLLPVAGGVTGGLTAVLAHYAGRDLRDGLTRDL